MRHREHPTPALLLRFMTGGTSAAETRTVVRHLISRCPDCLAVLRPIWRLADHPLQPAPKTTTLPSYIERLEKMEV